MPSIEFEAETPYQFYLRLTLGKVLMEPNTWTYMPFKVTANKDPKPLVLPTEEIYDFDVSPLIDGHSWSNWIAESIPSSFMQWEIDPLGDRGAYVAILKYEQDAPKDEWDTEFGKYVETMPSLCTNYGRAAGNAETFMLMPGGLITVKDYKITGTQKICINVVAYQDSTNAINLFNGDIIFRVTRYIDRSKR